MKILITGSEGFVGKNLISRLNKKKLDYISVSKKTGNILSQKLWNQLPKCNLVIHLASKANIDESWKSIFEYNKTNVLGTLRVLEYCRKHNSKLIFLSSYMYGSKSISTIERDKVIINNPYALSKKISEEYCKFYSKNFNIGITVLRIFNLYGYGQKNNFFIPNLINKLTINEQIILNKSIKRDYLYIEDFISLLMTIATNNDLIKKYEIFNVGSGKSYNILQIAKILKKLTNSKSNLLHTDFIKRNGIIKTKANINKICNYFSWQPNTNLNTGLKKYLIKLKNENSSSNN